MEHDISLDFKRVLRPAVKLLEVMPAVGGVSVQEDAAGRGIAEPRRAGELMYLYLFLRVHPLIYRHGLRVDGHFNAVGQAFCDGIIGKEAQ